MRFLFLFSALSVRSLGYSVIGEESKILLYSPKDPLYRPGRIVAGYEAKKEEALHQVSIQAVNVDKYREHFCGGSLIDSNWVLSAGHCMEDVKENGIVVVMGGMKLSDGIMEECEVQNIIIHPEFDPNQMKNDISLLKIKRNKSTRGMSKPIALQTQKDLSGKQCLITGWGRTKLAGSLPDHLLAAKVELKPDNWCKRLLSLYAYSVFQKNVCAGGGSTDACQGDSGGPMTCCSNEKDFSSCYLTGVTSWGIGCATPGLPGVYTEVAYYVDWIKAVMNSYN